MWSYHFSRCRCTFKPFVLDGAVSGSLSLRLASSLLAGFMLNRQLLLELPSFHWISQAYPGATTKGSGEPSFRLSRRPRERTYPWLRAIRLHRSADANGRGYFLTEPKHPRHRPSRDIPSTHQHNGRTRQPHLPTQARGDRNRGSRLHPILMLLRHPASRDSNLVLTH